MTISNEGKAMIREFDKIHWDAGNLNIAVRPPLGNDVPSRVYADHAGTCSSGGSMALMSLDCRNALEGALTQCEGNEVAERVLLEFASVVVKAFRHEMYDAAKVWYPEYLTDFGKQVVDEVTERYKYDKRDYSPKGENVFKLGPPNPYAENPQDE